MGRVPGQPQTPRHHEDHRRTRPPPRRGPRGQLSCSTPRCIQQFTSTHQDQPDQKPTRPGSTRSKPTGEAMKIVRKNTISSPLAASSLCLIALLILACGCNTGKAAPTPANFTLAINNHFLDHPDCLLADTRFPLETTDPQKTRQMDSLLKD